MKRNARTKVKKNITFQIESIVEVRHRSVGDLLQDDSEAVDVSFLSSVDRSSCHTQQLRCCPQLISIELELTLLIQGMEYTSHSSDLAPVVFILFSFSPSLPRDARSAKRGILLS